MGVISTVVDVNPHTISAAVGDRIICIAASRGGAASGTVTPNTGGTWSQVVGEYTLPADSNARRAIAIFELVVTSTITSVSYTAQMKDSGNVDVGTKAIWLVIQEGSEYSVSSTASANNGSTTSTTQATGTTASIPAGNHLIIAAAAARGGTTVAPSWTLTDITPPLVGGGDGNLDSIAGAGPNGNAAAGGYLLAAGAAAQTRSDTITLDTARLISAAIAVWVESTGAAVDLAGVGSAAASASGVFNADRPLATHADAASDLDGSADVARTLASSAPVASSASAAPDVARALSASSNAASGASAELSIQGQLAIAGSGASAASATGVTRSHRPYWSKCAGGGTRNG